jgi:hypothetical protein
MTRPDGGSPAKAGQPQRRVKTVVEAPSRRRLLQARYLGWTRASNSRPGLFAPAGEDVGHAFLAAAVEEVRHLFNGATRVAGGPLDDAAYYFVPTKGRHLRGGYWGNNSTASQIRANPSQAPAATANSTDPVVTQSADVARSKPASQPTQT